LGSPTCSEEDGSTGSDLLTLRDQLEETYTSSLFQTEPLYQFYDNDLNEVPLHHHLMAKLRPEPNFQYFRSQWVGSQIGGIPM